MADNVQVNVPTTSGATIATEDVSGIQHQKVKVEFGADGVATMVDASNPLPVADATMAAKDFATQTTLAALLAKVIAAPSTEAKQDSIITLLTAISGYVDGLEGKDYATQTTLAAVLAKIIAAPSTEAKQDTGNTSLSSIDGKLTTLNAKDFATQTTLAAVLAKIIAAPATEAKQDALNTLATTLNSIVATAAKQDTGNVSVASVDTKMSTLLTQTDGIEVSLTSIDTKTTNISNIDVLLSTRLKAADTLTAVGSISSALPAGTNLLGKVSIDQTTPGTSNIVSLPVTDGKWHQEVMTQVLLELRILNQMFSELPIVLSSKTGRFDEPNKFRNDQTIFAE